MNTTFTINVQGEIRFPDIALLAQAMMGQSAPVALAPQPVNPTPAPGVPAPQMSPTAPPSAIPTAHSAPAPTPNTVVPGTEPPRYSVDDIARAGAELAQQGPDKITALTSLLQQFGLQAVTQLQPEQMGPFVVALRGLGARI